LPDPIRQRKDSKAEEDRQRREMHARDIVGCKFEKFRAGRWKPCGVKDANDMAHIIRRGHLSKAAKYHVDMVMLACRTCHTEYDDYLDGVRVPYARAEQAWNTAVSLCKIVPYARYNPAGDPRYAV
jgi:5-methylcytosine-specific restriction endonuclease McrA